MSSLTLLAVRHNENGSYLSHEEMCQEARVHRVPVVPTATVEQAPITRKSTSDDGLGDETNLCGSSARGSVSLDEL